MKSVCVLLAAVALTVSLSAIAQTPTPEVSPTIGPWNRLSIETDADTGRVYAKLLGQRFDDAESLKNYILALPEGTRISYVPMDAPAEGQAFTARLREIKELCAAKKIHFWIKEPYL